MSAWKDVVLACGIALLVLDLWDLLRSLVVPRPWSRGPFVMLVGGLRRLARGAIELAPRFETRDRFLSGLEGVIVLVRLGIWLVAALVGYALVFWATSAMSITSAFVRSGSDIFTLGFATPKGAGPSAVSFLAASAGLIIVALQIAYLPALYDAFNRRETLVSLLESRAATPAWGPELLARHHLIGLESELGRLYADWERWAADVAESHTTYPNLLHLRSPHPTNSWIVGLVAVMDAAALQLALNPSSAPSTARMCVRMGFSALRDISAVLKIPYDPDPIPDGEIQLTYDEFEEGVSRLVQAGIDLERTPEEAWPHFRGWRINYESLVYELAWRISAPPAPWTGPRRRDPVPLLPLRPVDRQPGHKTVSRATGSGDGRPRNPPGPAAGSS